MACTVTERLEGGFSDGRPVYAYTLATPAGQTATVLNYGATLTHWSRPDAHGVVRDVVLGYDTWKACEASAVTDNCYVGVVVGRYANRIANGRFTLDGRVVEVDRNTAGGRHHLHGGAHGFDKRLWDSRAHSDRVTFQLRSEDGDGGYPGQLDAAVTYRLSDADGLTIEYVAVVAGAPTVVNLVNHAYFNLSGLSAPIFGTELAIHADAYLATDADSIPTGELVPVHGTRFDFTSARPLAPPGTTDATFDSFDQCLVLRGPVGTLRPVATAYEPATGLELHCATTLPGMQLYTGAFLSSTPPVKAVHRAAGTLGAYGKHAGFCLEFQQLPDAPNQAAFPSTVLRPGATYSHATVYRLDVRRHPAA